MGSGKTTLGRRVARTLGLDFHDCDEEIERHTGASVSLIFDIEGEAGFRDREARMLTSLARRDGVLVATGGGAVLRDANRELLRRRGLVVWLHTTVDQQLERLRLDRQRPLLQTPDRRERLEALAAERDPLYAAVAHLDFRPRQAPLPTVATQLAEAITAELARREEHVEDGTDQSPGSSHA
jgi:shikimate kinase